MELDYNLNDLLEKVNNTIENSNAVINNKAERDNMTDIRIKFDRLSEGFILFIYRIGD